MPLHGSNAVGNKSFIATWLLGGLGIDRFRPGKIGTGILERVTLGLWALVYLVITLAGKQRDKQGPAKNTVPAAGVPFTVKMSGGNVSKITIVSAVRTESVSTQAYAPMSKNGSLLLVDVLWATESGTPRSNPLSFNAKDAVGRKCDVELFADSPLPSSEVKVGDKSHGFVAFDMAPGAATVVIKEPLL